MEAPEGMIQATEYNLKSGSIVVRKDTNIGHGLVKGREYKVYSIIPTEREEATISLEDSPGDLVYYTLRAFWKVVSNNETYEIW